ncbi:MAG: hypothetical protein ABIV94_06560 [Acidimicrobiales bacterium]
MFTLVICLVVVVAAFVVVIRAIDPAQPATLSHSVGSARRRLDAETAEAKATEAPVRVRRPPSPPRARRPSAPVPPVATSPARRLRSALLLAVLLAAVGTLAALAVGLLIVVIVTVLRTAIG